MFIKTLKAHVYRDRWRKVDDIYDCSNAHGLTAVAAHIGVAVDAPPLPPKSPEVVEYSPSTRGDPTERKPHRRYKHREMRPDKD